MRPRWHRKNLVVWSSSAGPSGWPGVTERRPIRQSLRRGQRRGQRKGRRRELRRRIRTGALIAAIGLIWLARIARARPGLAFVLAGALLLVAGNMLPSGAAFIAGMMIFLRGAAVLLGVSEPRRPGGQPAGGADFFGFGTPPPGPGVSGQG